MHFKKITIFYGFWCSRRRGLVYNLFILNNRNVSFMLRKLFLSHTFEVLICVLLLKENDATLMTCFYYSFLFCVIFMHPTNSIVQVNNPWRMFTVYGFACIYVTYFLFDFMKGSCIILFIIYVICWCYRCLRCIVVCGLTIDAKLVIIGDSQQCMLDL